VIINCEVGGEERVNEEGLLNFMMSGDIKKGGHFFITSLFWWKFLVPKRGVVGFKKG
jgi:hypothetical protein